jgi:mannose-1-phosphate guanylyltransferase
MIIVIIAGGSGTRLWPLSVGSYPKHLLKLTGDRSGVQAAYDRARRLTDKIYVVTEQGHAHHVKEQLEGLPESAYIIEPGRRGTAGCIVAALERVAREQDPEEPIAFHWADHVIRDVEGFTHAFQVAGDQSKKHGRITLVGIEPTHPSTLFGYIEKGNVLDTEAYSHEVKQFKEKPDLEVAKKFFDSGRYLWNGGYLVGSVHVFTEALKKFAPERYKDFERLTGAKTPEEYIEIYLSFESDAIDYVLNEKVDNLLVIPATFDWRDIGGFGDLYDALSPGDGYNVIVGDGATETIETENSFIRNDESKPVAVIGLDNVVVVNTEHGILVARKDISQKVKEIVKKLEAGEEKPAK